MFAFIFNPIFFLLALSIIFLLIGIFKKSIAAFVAAGILLVLFIGGILYFTAFKMTTQKQNNVTAIEESTVYAGGKSGLNFTVPARWVISTDEGGNLYTYRQNPYLTVTFKIFADKASWQKRIDEWNGEIKKGNTTVKDSTIRGLSVKLIESGISGNYYVDTGTKWFEISTADQSSAEITQIIQSIKF